MLPQSSFDLEGLAEHRDSFPCPVLVSRPGTIRRSNDKAECYALLRRIGVPAPDFRRVDGAAASERAARELGYPERPVCFKPVFSSGSRGFRVLDPTVDRAHQLLYERPGSGRDAARGGARAAAGVEASTCSSWSSRPAGSGRSTASRTAGASCSATRRRARRCGQGSRCTSSPSRTRSSWSSPTGSSRALEIEWFFNIQLVGDLVIEVNPRISTIVYQEDFNLPYLGVKRALGEISDDELGALASRVRPGRTALRYFDQVEWDA